jgi:hypothetical protein
MKVLMMILPLATAITILTYLNMWQMKYVAPGKILNRDVLLFLIWYGLIIYFLVNPVIVLTFRYGFQIWQKVLAPQFIYQALPIACSLIIAWCFFREVPSKGTLAATILSVISIFCIIFWK